MDCRKLEKFLAEGNYKEGDRETWRLMLWITCRETEGWLRTEDVHKLPCYYLNDLDKLWLQSSHGWFGFSVQKDIYRQIDNSREYNSETWQTFSNRLGWYKGGMWLKYSNFSFNLIAPKGHLPACRRGMGDRVPLNASFLSGLVGYSLIQRSEECL